ncbi:MAG TPA: YqgE/AlgH family protein [Patescibacteria group bacterium]|nr:YqgE/AlgH family protein [Patescibacteria group bacterium]
MANAEVHAGSILVAKPALDVDPSFRRTVVFLFNHSSEGASGVDLTHGSPVDLIPEFFNAVDPAHALPEGQRRFYWGGPQPLPKPMVLMVTDSSEAPADARPVGNSGFSVVALVKDGTDITGGTFSGGQPKNIVPFIGYGGWGGGQIESEIQREFWAVAPVKLDELLAVPPEQRWEVAAKAAGIAPAPANS